MDLRNKIAKSRAIHVDRTRMHWVFTLALVCLIMGGLLGLQLTSGTKQLGAFRERFPGGSYGAISQALNTSQSKINEQAIEITSLRKQLDDYAKAAAKEKPLMAPLAAQLAEMKIATGLTWLKGPGIELELNDSTMNTNDIPLTEIKESLVIHDFDLLQTVNELWVAGAEAIAINGQRITGGTAIRCVGPVTEINKVSVAAPFKIIALGDPDTLTGALNIPGGILDRLRPLKFRIRLEEKQNLTVPPISTVRNLRTAKSIDAPPVPPPTEE